MITMIPSNDGLGAAKTRKREKPMLNVTSLREQVYDFLRKEMHQGRLPQGTTIDLNKIAKELGISRTPLRDALIRLETEGFVETLPRRGIRVATLRMKDIKNIYEIIGYIEGGIILDCFQDIGPRHVEEMRELNDRIRQALRDDDFDTYYRLNLKFHGVYVDLSDNDQAKFHLIIMKQRLYDFPRRSYIKEWELSNCDEHDLFIEAVAAGDRHRAASVMRGIHWSFKVQEQSIRRFYSEVVKQIEADAAAQAAAK
jgi:DNA-binding GntR family transcriptional regulator